MLKDVVVIFVDDKPVAIAELRQMTLEQIDAFKETCRLNREALKKQELSPLCPRAKLVHSVEFSPSLFPDTLPRIPRSFKKEVKDIFETMSPSGANIHPGPK